jgi:hypothetical protein
MLSSKFLKDIMTEAYPIIQRQLEDAKVIASFRELVTANGGDWSALKALMKAHVEDSLDESGEGKRVRKILDKADSSNAYAEMLGLANMNEKNFISGDDEQGEERPDTISALLSDTSLGLVRASSITKPEPQPLTQAGSDLTTPQALNGQVADIPAAVEAQRSTPVDDVGGSGEANSHGDADSESRSAPLTQQGIATPDSLGNEAGRPQSATLQSDTSGRKAPPIASPVGYAAPGVVTYENHPPEGVERSAISIAFGNMGQDGALIQDDLANGRAQPIVKQGNVILDGWARYMTARNMTELDGSPLTYAVVQYNGTDPLIDVIRWNVEGRMLNEQQKRLIAQTLTRQHPKRKDDIYRAFELWMEPV